MSAIERDACGAGMNLVLRPESSRNRRRCAQNSKVEAAASVRVISCMSRIMHASVPLRQACEPRTYEGGIAVRRRARRMQCLFRDVRQSERLAVELELDHSASGSSWCVLILRASPEDRWKSTGRPGSRLASVGISLNMLSIVDNNPGVWRQF